MQLTKTTLKREDGSTLLLAIFIVTLLGIMIGLAFDYTANTTRTAARTRDYSAAQALGNGALETIYKRWKVYMAANQSQTQFSNYATETYFQTGFTNNLKSLINSAAASTGFTVNELTIWPVNRSDIEYETQSLSYASTGPMTNVPGWIAATTSYRAKVVVYKTSDPSLTVSISRYFQAADASLFQAMLFFQDDLELHPGPAMTLYGLIHTNSNLYAAAGSGGSLTFSSDVSYTGNQTTMNPASNYKYEIANGYTEGVTQTLYNQESGNWTNFNAPIYTTSRSSQLSQVQSLDPLGTDVASAIDPTNPNASGTHEIIERPAPISATNPSANAAHVDPSAFSAHRIYNGAGLRVFINHNTAYATSGAPQNIHVYVPTDIVNNPGASTEIIPGSGTPGNPTNIANQIINSITLASPTGNIFDFREGRNISVSTIDMSQLTPALNNSSLYNGVLYVTDITNADSNGNMGNSDAIRLVKGGQLPNAGFTLATDGAVYVQGDFNTGDTYLPNVGGLVVPAVQPVSNTGADPTQFTVPGYTRKLASVMGDAVMILSNNWQDSLSNQSVNARVATPTTFNAAIVSGSVLTTATAASGGAHNFPRFLENWGSMNFTYYGSMCELYASTHFTGTYGKSNVYSPPNRRWFFDNNFLTGWPPGNLRTTTYTRGRWVRNDNVALLTGP